MTDRFDEKFLEMEQEFSQKAFRLHDLERQARADGSDPHTGGVLRGYRGHV